MNMMNEADRTDLLPSEAARFDEVCRLGHDQLESIATTVALSFADDPVWRWLFSGDQTPMTTEQMMGFARYLVSRVVAPKEIHGFRHHRAVALWHPPITTDSDTSTADSSEPDAYFADHVAPLMVRVGSLGELAAALQARRPKKQHWYLGIIGTLPGHQGQGMGARLLQTMHSRCDRLGLSTYLESSNPANYDFYRRNQYVETEEFAVAGSPPLIGFSRAAQ